jgi:hypothetical protein
MTIPIVNLFIVGMPKAGTTSLHQYLSQHPDVCMSEDKEPHFFSVDLLNEGEVFHGFPKYTRYPTRKDYHQLFSQREKEKIVGESSVFYLFSRLAAGQIKEYNPDAKIIIMIREPVSFLYSLHSQGVYSGNEVEKDFEKAMDLQDLRRLGKELPSTVHFPSRLFYDDHIHTSEHIERYLEHFPKQNIRIILFDDFIKDTSKSYCETLQFLGVDESHIPELSNRNPNTTIRSPKLMTMLQDPQHPVSKVVKKVLPKSIVRKGKSVLKNANTKVEDRKQLSIATRDSLRKKYKPNVFALNELLHKEDLLGSPCDLMSLWGYDK